MNIADEARVPIECEVLGEFRHLVPFQLLEEGGELGFSHQRAGSGSFIDEWDRTMKKQTDKRDKHTIRQLTGLTRLFYTNFDELG